VKANAQRKACFGNERIVEGAYMAYQAEFGIGAAQVITDWAGLMTVLPPTILKDEPHCPGGGVYSWTSETCACTIHGSFQ